MSKDRKDIVELKPGAYGISIDLCALWNRFIAKPKNDPVLIVAQRFLKIFNDHGVAVSQIPRLIPQLTLEQLRTAEDLLPALTVQIIHQAAQLFQVQRAWLEGTSERIYENRWCYKNPERFFKDLSMLQLEGVTYPVVAFCCDQKLNKRSRHEQPVVLVMVEKCADLGDKEIYRYRIYNDEWIWNYFKSRIQIKAMIRIVEKMLNVPTPLYRVRQDTLRKIVAGLLVPTLGFSEGVRLRAVSLEDFSLSSDESAVSKESDELPRVLKYIEDYDLDGVTSRYESLGIAQRAAAPFYLSFRSPVSSLSTQSGS